MGKGDSHVVSDVVLHMCYQHPGNRPALFLPSVQVVNHKPLCPVLEGLGAIIQRWYSQHISEKSPESAYFFLIHNSCLHKHNIICISGH